MESNTYFESAGRRNWIIDGGKKPLTASIQIKCGVSTKTDSMENGEFKREASWIDAQYTCPG